MSPQVSREHGWAGIEKKKLCLHVELFQPIGKLVGKPPVICNCIT